EGSFTVTVRDTIAPELTLPADRLAEASARAGALVSYPAAGATDAVGPVTITCSQASGTTCALGGTLVTVRATDGAGNFSEGSFTVTVRDTIAPELTLPADRLAEASSPAGALVSYPAAGATDAVGPVTITYSQASGTTFALEIGRASGRERDGAGDFSEGSFTVTVRDTIAPELTLPADRLAEASSSGGAVVRYPAA